MMKDNAMIHCFVGVIQYVHYLTLIYLKMQLYKKNRYTKWLLNETSYFTLLIKL